MKKLGIGITGSFCNLINTLDIYEELAKEYEITFFVSYTVQKEINRFIEYSYYKGQLLKIGKVIESISEAEKYGPFFSLDIFLILPLTANSLNKLYNGIYDTPVLMAAKAHLRTNKPLVVGVASNDYLGISGKNLFGLINLKNIYVIPFKQDDPLNKPNSIVADFSLTKDTLNYAYEGYQIQPILLWKK